MSGYGPGQDIDYTRLQELISDEERWLTVVYVVCALNFMTAIFNFQNPATSQYGNMVGILGMVVALCGTMASTFVNGYGYWIFIGLFLGIGALAVFLAIKVKLTEMPMFVGFLNAMGGLAAALESLAFYISPIDADQQDYEMQLPWGAGGIRFQVYNTIFYLLGMIIGVITFTGSCTACAKLMGKFSFSSPKGKKLYNKLLKFRLILTLILGGLFLIFAIAAGSIGIGVDAAGITMFVISFIIAGIYGVYFVLCIGGADMPVVIALLNSLSGWSTVFAGLAFQNELMMIAGCFVGASGLILSYLMCNAMNRSLKNVLMGGFGGETTVEADAAHLDAYVSDYDQVAKCIVASQLVYIVPGYGMAVSQAQKEVASLVEAINDSGREARCAVHPVAGRLPGHMNVLLAEASVPYNFVDDITANEKFKDTDLVLIVGANDIYNPAAKFDKGSNIYGMEVLEVWQAKRTVVVKRSMRTGYAGIDNALFYYPQNSMLLGDAKECIQGLTTAFKAELAKKDPDSAETFVSGDNQRIEARKQEEQRLKAAQAKTGDQSSSYEEDGPLSDVPLPVTIGILREPEELNDDRIPIHPKDIVAMLTKKQWGIERVLVEEFGDDDDEDEPFITAGARVEEREYICRHADIVVSMSIPEISALNIIGSRHMGNQEQIEDEEIYGAKIIDGKEELWGFRARNRRPIIISVFGNPSGTKDLQQHCANLGITLLSMDIMPRVTTAQCMDVLSSSAKVAGFRSVIEACNQYGRLVGAEITAAGSYKPAKALVVGCGVAGLAAVGDLNRLGAEVRAFDVRKECFDQVKSMGGKFLLMDFGDEDGGGAGGYANIMSDEFIKKEMALLHDQAKECDLFILTAAIPGRKAPILIKDYHVADMKKGSVIIDLAAPTGGNCEITKPGQNYVTDNGVIVVGKVDFVKGAAAPISSEMLSANLMNWLEYNVKTAGSLNVYDLRNPLIRAICLAHQGELMFPPPRPPAPPAPQVVEESDHEEEVVKQKWLFTKNKKMFNASPSDWVMQFVILLIFGILGYTAPESLNSRLMILVLASWAGYLLIIGVTVALHTPLMSLTNAISGIVILAAMLSVSPLLAAGTTHGNALCDTVDEVVQWWCQERSAATITINALALAAASMNVVGGFAVTHRMLLMFKARE